MSERQALRTTALLERMTRQSDVKSLFAPGRVAVGISERVAAMPQAQLILSLAVNLLVRLFPVVQEIVVSVPSVPIVGRLPRWSATTLDQHLHLLLTELASPVDWRIVEHGQPETRAQLWIGEPPSAMAQACFIGSENWYAYVSPHEPQPVGGYNPVGAYTAACFGVAEVFKKLLLPHQELFDGIPIKPIKQLVALSTYSYRVRLDEPNPALPENIDLGRLTFVGLGAGGGAAAFTLATLPALAGILNLVEPDEFEEPNLNRYIFATANDAFQRLPKTVVVEHLFAGTRVEIRAFTNSFRQARPTLTLQDLEYLLATVHSREARRELQYETPRVLWDAGATQDGEFRIWRLILGQTECMFCKHPPSEDDPERQKAAQLAELLGLNREVWLRKLRDNLPFTEDEVNEIAHHFTDQNEVAVPRTGQRFGDWEAEQCGKLKLPTLEEEIPIPFAPVLAGVLVAGEIIKGKHFPEAVLDSYYWNTLLGQFMSRNQPNRRQPLTNCSFCKDAVYLDQYRRRWLVQG